jgi:acetyl esterase
MPKKPLVWAAGVVIVLAIAIFTASQVSPWSSALNYRLYRLTMPHVAARLNERYDTSNPDAVLDVYYPSEVENTDRSLPTIVWVHGGAFRAGSKDGIADYLKILAAKNYTLVGVNYSLAPAKIYPTPILQVNAALAFLEKNAARLHVDASKLFLAGDSAGAQIAAQLAVVISNSAYADQMGVTPSIDRRQLKGVILHCGLYDLRGGGETRASIARTYLGNEDFLNDPRLEEFSVVRNITADFPPMFISVGNADRLESQSQLLADTATKLGISVDSLFFPNGYTPPLPHEYQFSLGSEAGRLALDRTVRFLAGRSH